MHTYGLGVYWAKKFEKPIIWFSGHRKKILIIRAILFSLITADQMDMGFSLNSRPKRSENVADTTLLSHSNYHRLSANQIPFTSIRPILK